MKIGTSYRPLALGNGFNTNDGIYEIVDINGTACTLRHYFVNDDNVIVTADYAGYIVCTANRNICGDLICYTWEVYAI